MTSPEQAARAFVEALTPHVRATWRPDDMLPALAALIAAERAAVREACAADVERRGRHREDCPPDCRCADAAHLAAALRRLPID